MGNRKTKYIPKDFETKSGKRGFVALYQSMLESPAYKALTSPARSVYTIIKAQYKGNYNSSPGNRVKCPYKDIMEHTHCSKATVSRALKELEEMGFIETDPGGLNVPNTYTFSSRWQHVTDDEAISIRRKHEGRKKPPSDGNI